MIVLVSGVAGRCGSSLLMQMLAASGVATIPAGPVFTFEDTRQLGGWAAREQLIQDAETLAARRGACAVKWLEPCLAPPPDRGGYRVLMASRRDKMEQAASIGKFGRALGAGSPSLSPVRQRLLATRIEQSEPDALERLRALPDAQVLVVAFERVLEDPAVQARRIAAFLTPLELDADAMAAVVRPRGPECYPGLLEDTLGGLV